MLRSQYNSVVDKSVSTHLNQYIDGDSLNNHGCFFRKISLGKASHSICKNLIKLSAFVMRILSKIELTHSKFILLFVSVLFVTLNIINYDKTIQWFVVREVYDVAGLIAFYLLVYAYTLAAFTLLAHKYTTKLIALAFISLSVPAAYFIAKYNVFIEHVMILNTLHTDAIEVSGLLSTSMLPYLIFLWLLPCLLVFRIRIRYHSFWRNLGQSLLIFAVASGLFVGSFYAKHDSIIRAINSSNQSIFHTLVPVNLILGIYSVTRDAIPSFWQQDVEPIEITGEITKQEDLLVVLVVGEAARQKSMEVYGYEGNDTTPYLNQYDDLHTLNGIAKYGSTIYALPQILRKNDVNLVNITSTLGVPTDCLVNFTFYENCDPIGETFVSDCGHNGRCYDEDVLPLLANALDNYKSGYRFLVLHFGGGSHGPIYQKRYPETFQKFRPQCTDANVMDKCSEQELYNAYDNSILYLDYLLHETLQQLDESNKPYVFMYISDHGESLMEEGRIFHGMPPGIALPPEQAQVPLLVRSTRPISIIKRDKYPQQDIFDTVLSLFSIETPLINSENSFIEKLD